MRSLIETAAKQIRQLRILRMPVMLWLAFVVSAFLSGLFLQKSIETYASFAGMYHDDAIYLTTAKALAAGEGYRILSLPGEPLQTKYPVGFPLMIAPAWLLFHDLKSMTWALSVVLSIVAFATYWLSVAYLLQIRGITHRMAWVIFSACCLNTMFHDFAPMVMSDFPAALFSVIALCVAESLSRKSYSVKQSLVLGVLVAVPIYMRVQGVAVALACSAFLFLRGKGKTVRTAVITAGVLLLPQIIWQIALQKSLPEHLGYYGSYGQMYRTAPDITKVPAILSEHFNMVGFAQLETALPFFRIIPYDRMELGSYMLYMFLSGMAGASLMIAAIRAVSIRRSLPGFFLWFTGNILVFWPARTEWRHVLPMLPFTYYLIFQSARWIASKMKPHNPVLRSTYAKLCAVLAIVFSTYLVGGTLWEAVTSTAIYGKSLAQVSGFSTVAELDAELTSAYDWLSKNTPPNAIIICNNDPLTYLKTGRKAVFPSRMESWRFAEKKLIDEESLLTMMREANADYLMVEPMYRSIGVGTEQSVASAKAVFENHPGMLKFVFASPKGLVNVFEIDKAKL